MHNHRPTDRLEYFSDAVLAIAATLLATELPKAETETGLLQTFTTGLLALHVGKPDERTAALIYHGTLVLMTLFYNTLIKTTPS